MWLILLATLTTASLLFAEDEKLTPGISNPELLKCVVSIELKNTNGSCQPIGTGFFVATPSNTLGLVSARHVVFPDSSKTVPTNLVFRISHTGGKSELVSDMELSPLVGPWFASSNADLALRFFPNARIADMKAIPPSLWLRASRIRQGAPLLVLGFPLGLRSEDYPSPIIRRGIVASPSNVNSLILDAFVFPGNSGGPVFFEPVVSLGAGNDLIKITTPDLDRTMLMGIVVEYISYNDVAFSAHTKQPRVMFQENSGLCQMIPVDQLYDLIQQGDVQNLQSRLLSK